MRKMRHSKGEDAYEGESVAPSSGGQKRDAAPEVSQGAWRDRVFTPRSVLSREEIQSGLIQGLKGSSGYSALLQSWLPFLRQAIEQAGGDGVDCWLNALFTKSKKVARQSLFDDLAKGLQAIRSTSESQWRAAAEQTVGMVDLAFQSNLAKLSFRQMERQLEGKLEVDALLVIHAEEASLLARRSQELLTALEMLREQVRTQPGNRPDGMYASFVRLKVERAVCLAELRHRQSTF